MVSREGGQTGLSREIFLGERFSARLGKGQLGDYGFGASSCAHGVPALSGRPVRRWFPSTLEFQPNCVIIVS